MTSVKPVKITKIETFYLNKLRVFLFQKKNEIENNSLLFNYLY